MDYHIHESAARKIMALEEEILIWREQIESLTQELDDERQQKNSYREELEYTMQEMESFNREIQDIKKSQALGLDEPKESGKRILKSNKSASEFLDDPRVAMEDFLAEIDDFIQIALAIYGKKYLIKSQLNMCKYQYHKLSDRFYELQATFRNLTDHFLSLKADLYEHKNKYRAGGVLSEKKIQSY